MIDLIVFELCFIILVPKLLLYLFSKQLSFIPLDMWCLVIFRVNSGTSVDLVEYGPSTGASFG